MELLSIPKIKFDTSQKNSALWILTCASLLFAIIFGFYNLDADKKEGEFYWQAHQEGTSLARTKDETLTPLDGFSKEFPIVYNFLGDYALGYVANVLAKPPYITQSFIYPKLLLAFFLVANFISIYLITRNRLASLLSALLLAFASDIIFFDDLYKLVDANLPGFKARMHLPSIALQLGVGQSAGWILFLPVIASAYLARKYARMGLYVLSGIGLGVLFQTHILTFINVITIVSVWFLVSETNEKPSLQRLRFAGLIAIFVCMVIFSREFGLKQLVLLWACAFILSIRERKDFLRLSVMGISALIVSSQFIYSLINSYALKGSLELHVDSSIDYRLVISYFLLYWCLFSLVLITKKSEPERLGIAVVVCTLAFGFGHKFGFYNHQYRFVINLCFGLFLLAPLAILKLNEFKYWHIPLENTCLKNREKWLPAFIVFSLGITLSGLLGFSVYRDVMIQTGHADKVVKLGYNPKYYNISYATKDEGAFLRALSTIPRKERVLLPPEDSYPRRVFHNSIILGSGDFRAFIPDYRYIVDKKSYKDRVFVYCSIFPDYPHFDAHYNDHFCSDFLSVARYRGRENEALDVLGIYGIKYLIHWPESSDSKIASLYDAKKYFENGSGFSIWKTSCDKAYENGRVCFGAAKTNNEHIEFSISSARNGRYYLCFSGQNLVDHINGIKLNGMDIAYTNYGTDTIGMLLNFNLGNTQNLNFYLKANQILTPVPIAPFYFASGNAMNDNKHSKCENM